MDAELILEKCNQLKYNVLINFYEKEDNLLFIMNTEHLKTISKKYTPEASLENVRDCKIMGHKVIHNENLPMNSILLGYETKIKDEN